MPPLNEHNYITTWTGQNIGPPDTITPDQIDMRDIRRALSMLCRYNGHVDADRFYSVAEHSVLVSQYAEAVGDTEAMLPGLLHDAHEAYCGDIPAPQKDMIPGFRKFEHDMELAVRRGLPSLKNVPPPVWNRVRQYDIALRHRELLYLRSILPSWFDAQIERTVPFGLLPVGFAPPEAENLFRNRLTDLLALRTPVR